MRLSWDFVMAASYHQACVVEIIVRLVKGIINSLLEAIGETVLLSMSLMNEVANLCNERSIGLKSNAQSGNQYLSPNSLMLGRHCDRTRSGLFQSKADLMQTLTLAQ